MIAGDEVTAGGEAGKVLRVVGTKIQVQVHGQSFWYDASQVSQGLPPPRPTFMAWRFSGRRRGITEEVQALCPHSNLPSACPDCSK